MNAPHTPGPENIERWGVMLDYLRGTTITLLGLRTVLFLATWVGWMKVRRLSFALFCSLLLSFAPLWPLLLWLLLCHGARDITRCGTGCCSWVCSHSQSFFPSPPKKKHIPPLLPSDCLCRRWCYRPQTSRTSRRLDLEYPGL